MHLKRRQTCRLCGSASLTKVIDLGEQYLQNAFPKPGSPLPCERKLPTELVLCDSTIDENACGLLQTRHTVPPEILYATYWYRSGVNQTMRDHLKEIAEKCLSLLGETDDGETHVLDIGCNDGTLLACYPKEIHKAGIDPSNIAAKVDTESIPNCEIINDFFPSSKLEDAQFDIITAIAMFYDLESPLDFLKEASSMLSDKGIMCIEVSHMPTMLERSAYDTICHEHIEYYSLATIEKALKRIGGELKVFDAELNDINGGSIRLYLSKRGDKPTENMMRIRSHEFESALEFPETYRRFQLLAEVRRHDLVAQIKSIRAKGKSIHVYGASTKGNTLLQWCGLDFRMIEAAAERNPEKHGAVTPGTNIPIISEEDSRKAKPDYYLVLPWGFRNEFIRRERQMIENGTQFIFPLPTIDIVGK